MLIIEGADMCGKTTFIHKMLLPQLPGHVYAHFGKLPARWDYFWSYLPHMAYNAVMDRFHLSEVVYRQARGENCKLSAETYRLLDAKLRLIGGVTVVFTADEELLCERFETLKARELHNLEQILKANQLFHDYVSMRQHDVDFHFHLTRDQPHVQEWMAREVLTLYLHRRCSIRAINERMNIDVIV